MSDIVIKVEDLSKMYRLGALSAGSLVSDVNRYIAKVRGKEDPYSIVGTNDRTSKAESEFVWSLKDINFEIKKGDAVGIIGRNGAGKSTLLKILSRVTAPTTGSVKIKGRVASLLEVGTGFHPELSGRDNIFMNGAILGMSRNEIKSKFDEIVDFAGVEKYIDTPVKRYSSGMYVRLAFAVAAHLDPDILIIDEVLAVGDIEFQKKCLGKMKDVNNKDGRTILFVSHNLSSVQALCTSAMLLQNGKFSLQGDVSDVLSIYSQNNRTNIQQRLSSRLDRTGSGDIKITDAYFKNINGVRVDNPITGSPLVIKIMFHSKYSKSNDFLFRLQFVDSNDSILFICNNEHSHRLFSSVEGDFSVECLIPKLPLFAGNYFIHIQCYSKSLGVLDEIEYALEFEVLEGDFFGTGKLPIIKKGVLIENRWMNE
ncbi:MAG: ABC transporter ATP-binding protein [Cytophagaceae bacterium]